MITSSSPRTTFFPRKNGPHSVEVNDKLHTETSLVFSLQLILIHIFFISLRVPPGCSTELNHAGYSFLMGLFEKYDRDKDDALSPQELIDLFSTCPVMPWGPDVLNSVHTNEKVCLLLHLMLLVYQIHSNTYLNVK